MDYFLVSLLTFAGAIAAFLSSLLYSLSHDKLQNIVADGDKRAKKLLNLKMNYDDSMGSYSIMEMILFAVASLLLGKIIFSNATPLVIDITVFAVFFLLIFTLRIVAIGVGMKLANGFALSISGILGIYAFFAKPFIYFSNKLIESITGSSHEEASREEISLLVESAHVEGSLDSDEYRILKNIMHFSEVYVSDVMTPRTVVFSCNADETISEIINKPEIKMYSRFPVWEGESLDEGVIGYVLSRDIMSAALDGKTEMRLRRLLREVYIVPENARLDDALEQFLQRRQHIFVVVDEYGGVEGLLTMEDVLETILGAEIVDEADKVIDLRDLAKKRRDVRVAQINQVSGE